MEEKKSNKGLMFVIIILLLIIIGLGCVIGYMLLNNGEETGNKKAVLPEYTEDEVITIEEAQKLVDKYYYDFYNSELFIDLNNDQMTFQNIEKYITLKNLESDGIKELNCNDYATKVYFNNEYQEYFKEDENLLKCTGKYISYDNLNNVYQELFGKNTTFEKNDFSVSFDKYVYINNSFEQFVRYGTGAHMPDHVNVYAVTDVNKTKDGLEILVGYDYYYDKGYEEATGVCVSKISDMPEYNCQELKNTKTASELINNNKNKVQSYKFKFFKENNIYKLKNIEKI